MKITLLAAALSAAAIAYGAADHLVNDPEGAQRPAVEDHTGGAGGGPGRREIAQIAGTQLSKRAEPRPEAKPRDTNLTSLSAYEVFTNVTVAPGQSVTLTSQQDWTGADRISIAVQCPSSTSLAKVGIGVAWSIPIANYFALTDVILGSNFTLPYTGGGTSPAYGNQLQLVMVNTGSTTVSCNQLTAYAVVH
jgi:hypothetical protein